MNYNQIQRQDSNSTKNATKSAVRAFRTYLTAKKVSVDFENFSKAELHIKLRSFYVNKSIIGNVYVCIDQAEEKYMYFNNNMDRSW
jgi:hypothetical protein